MREQRVADHDLRHRVGRVGELERRADVARRVDARVAGPQVGVDPHAGAVAGHAGLLQSEPFHVRRPARADENLVHRRLARLPVRGVADPFAPAGRVGPGDGLHAVDRGAQREAHAVVLHARLDDGRGVGILPRQDARRPLEHRHGAAEAGECLRQLATDGAGADDGEPPRQLRQGEDRLVGQEAGFREARDRRGGGARAGADDGPREAQRSGADAHRVAPAEAPLAEEDVDAEAPVALGGVDAADLRPQPAHAGHGGAEVALDAARERQAELGPVPRRRPDARRPEDPLRRHAADVEAVAAHQAAFDQGHPGAESRGHHRGHQPGRARADHDQVVAAVRGRVLPLRRTDVGGEPAVELVVREQGVDHAGFGGGADSGFKNTLPHALDRWRF